MFTWNPEALDIPGDTGPAPIVSVWHLPPAGETAPVQCKPVARGPHAGARLAPSAGRSDSEAMLAAWSTARWVDEQEALAAQAVRRAAARHALRRAPDLRAAGRAAHAAMQRQRHRLVRMEAVLRRVLPAGFGCLLGLFLCVTLSMALLSSMLPLVDRL